jgi:hypothetical protein
LSERVGKLSSDDTGNDIGRAARRDGDDELDRAVRVVRLSVRDVGRSQDKGRDNEQKAWQASHPLAPSSDPIPPKLFIAVTAGVSMHVKLSENFRAVFYAPFYATHALGFYGAEGVDVELLSSPAPAAAAKGLLDGSIDISWGGPMRVMKAHDEDPRSPMVCFCEVAARDPFFPGWQWRSFGISAR